MMRILVLVLLVTAAACTQPTPPAPPPAPAPAPAAVVAPADAATMTAILATADAADGITDKVVTKCAGCRLGMDGNAENSMQLHGYTLHFCSDACKAMSEPKIESVITDLK